MKQAMKGSFRLAISLVTFLLMACHREFRSLAEMRSIWEDCMAERATEITWEDVRATYPPSCAPRSNTTRTTSPT